MPTARGTLGAVFAATLFVVACDRPDVRISSKGRDRSSATFAARDSARKLGPGDLVVLNADSSIELGVIGDSIITGFGPRVLAEIEKSTDTSTVTGGGLGAGIEKFVKNTVASALNKEIKYAVADVQSVRYQDGKLEFFWKDGSRMRLFENTHKDNTPVSETFRPDDANRFVAAFDAKKAR
ncbi:MAG TPA: hypothetical protein VIP11_00565 [Gemmatimonadaceae bacterium]